MKRQAFLALLMTASLAGTAALSGCQIGNTVSTSTVENAVESAATDTIEKQAGTEETTAQTESGTLDLEAIIATGMFTERDFKTEYDAEDAARITLSDDEISSDSNAVQIVGSTVTIVDEGTYILSGSLTNGMILIDVEDSDKVQLVLDGVSISNATSAAIYVKNADKVFLTTTEGSENTLSNGGEYTAIDDNNIDAVIFSKSDLTLNGLGTLIIEATAGNGVTSKDDLVVTGGSYQITAKKHGLEGKDSLKIADGTFTVTAGEDALHADNDEDTDKGYLYLAGGDYTLSAGDDGIHSSSALTINAGTIHITDSYEGLEGLSIDITGGEIDLKASDDGLNAAGGNDNSGSTGNKGFEDIFAVVEGAYINISGGTLYVNADGDGIDSNGDLTISGGEIYVSGPTNGANGALDYNGDGIITGGILIAAGAQEMAQNLSSESTQGVIMISVNQEAEGSEITLTSADGEELLSWTPEKAYSSVVISHPDIVDGGTYTITTGSDTTEITMEGLVYGSAGGFGAGGFGGGGFGGKGGPRGDFDPENFDPENFDPSQFEGQEPPTAGNGDMPEMPSGEGQQKMENR